MSLTGHGSIKIFLTQICPPLGDLSSIVFFMRNSPGTGKGNRSYPVSNPIILTEYFFFGAYYGIGKEIGLSSEVLGDF